MQKPRDRGITVVSAKAKSLVETQSIVEAVGDIIDHVKQSDHVGLMWRDSVDLISKRNAFYAAAGIHTLPGGIPFEVAAVHGKVPQFMRRMAELGFGGVEVSECSLDLTASDRAAAIRMGRERGLEVFTELGKKFPERPLDASEAIDTAMRDLEAGASWIVVEKSDVALVIEKRLDSIHRLMEGVGKDKLIIECGPGEDRFRVAKWLIGEFGPDVNLENIDVSEAHVVEAMRYGLNRAADYTYFREFKGKRPLGIATA
jgi:phosphosulfolactate synthase